MWKIIPNSASENTGISHSSVVIRKRSVWVYGEIEKCGYRWKWLLTLIPCAMATGPLPRMWFQLRSNSLIVLFSEMAGPSATPALSPKLLWLKFKYSIFVVFWKIRNRMEKHALLNQKDILIAQNIFLQFLWHDFPVLDHQNVHFCKESLDTGYTCRVKFEGTQTTILQDWERIGNFLIYIKGHEWYCILKYM